MNRRPWLAFVLLAVALLLAWRAGIFDSRRTRRFLEPPTRQQMDEAAARDSARQAARTAQAQQFAALDPPVTIGQMLLWFSLPIAGTVLLVFLTGGRRPRVSASERRP